MNCKIHPVLYDAYLRLHEQCGAEIVHRRQRKSDECIEIIFYSDYVTGMSGHVNTLAEAERSGYWVICRRQTKRGHTVYNNRPVYQLYLSPVHPKKRREELYNRSERLARAGRDKRLAVTG